MKSVLETVLMLLKKVLYFVLEYFFVFIAFAMKCGKTRMKKWDVCRARKRLDQACAALGKDIYSLYTQGLTNYQDDSSVTEKIKAVEEAEANLLAIEQDTQSISNDYFKKKEEIKAKYAEKRGSIKTTHSDDDEAAV